MASPFDALNAALTGKQTPKGGTENKSGYNSAKFSANPNIEKMNELGLKEMPEGGQEDLDKMYAEYQKKKPKYKKLYKDTK